jgi:phosphoglycerate dehydrogenase-like enzyme
LHRASNPSRGIHLHHQRVLNSTSSSSSSSSNFEKNEDSSATNGFPAIELFRKLKIPKNNFSVVCIPNPAGVGGDQYVLPVPPRVLSDEQAGQERGRILGMGNENPVPVLASEDDPRFAMLDRLPHTVCGEVAACAHAGKDATVILLWSGTRELLRELLGICGKVRWIHTRAAGLDNLLFPELVESQILLTNGRGVFSKSLGEFVLGAILYFAKDFRRMVRNQTASVWEQFDVQEIAGQTVGILGYGDIGRAVASRVHAMGMRVLAMKRHVPGSMDPLVEHFYKPEERREMIALSDYIVVTAPLTEETRHMISDAEFAVMKPTAVVINVGRGPVMDEAALLRALAAERIKGAGLDVFEHEPLPAGHLLYKLDNVLLSPHCADHTADWQDQAMRFFLEQYRRFEKGEPLKNIVNKRLGY